MKEYVTTRESSSWRSVTAAASVHINNWVNRGIGSSFIIMSDGDCQVVRGFFHYVVMRKNGMKPFRSLLTCVR